MLTLRSQLFRIINLKIPTRMYKYLVIEENFIINTYLRFILANKENI